MEKNIQSQNNLHLRSFILDNSAGYNKSSKIYTFVFQLRVSPKFHGGYFSNKFKLFHPIKSILTLIDLNNDIYAVYSSLIHSKIGFYDSHEAMKNPTCIDVYVRIRGGGGGRIKGHFKCRSISGYQYKPQEVMFILNRIKN